jgi:hypothetical protein
MSEIAWRGAVNFGALLLGSMLAACTSDIDYRGYLPPALAIGAQSMFMAREFGECSVEAFRISETVAAQLAMQGSEFFLPPSALTSSEPANGVQLTYVPWQSLAVLDITLPKPVRDKALWSSQCLSEHPVIEAAYRAALNTPGEAYFSYSNDDPIKPNLIIVLPADAVVLVAPY